MVSRLCLRCSKHIVRIWHAEVSTAKYKTIADIERLIKQKEVLSFLLDFRVLGLNPASDLGHCCLCWITVSIILHLIAVLASIPMGTSLCQSRIELLSPSIRSRLKVWGHWKKLCLCCDIWVSLHAVEGSWQLSQFILFQHENTEAVGTVFFTCSVQIARLGWFLAMM